MPPNVPVSEQLTIVSRLALSEGTLILQPRVLRPREDLEMLKRRPIGQLRRPRPRYCSMLPACIDVHGAESLGRPFAPWSEGLKDAVRRWELM